LSVRIVLLSVVFAPASMPPVKPTAVLSAIVTLGVPGSGFVAVSVNDVVSTTVTDASSRLERYAGGPASVGATLEARKTAATPPRGDRVRIRGPRCIGFLSFLRTGAWTP